MPKIMDIRINQKRKYINTSQFLSQALSLDPQITHESLKIV